MQANLPKARRAVKEIGDFARDHLAAQASAAKTQT
jgi:hypothetical protein